MEQYATAGASGATNIASRMGEVVGGAPAGRVAERSRPTLHGAITNTHRVDERLDETGARLNAMAEYAEQLATRLCGSYPTEGPGKDARVGSSERGPMSTVEALNAAVDGLHPRITAFDSPLNRIARAFDMIESAHG